MGSEDNFDMEYLHAGKLELIMGNMFSGKSTELIRRINKTKSINKKIMVINHASDTRNKMNVVCTHDNNKINCIKLNSFANFNTDLISQFDSYFIDEAQFFPDLYTFVVNLVDVHKKHVVVAGLDGDTCRNNFGDLHKLISVCDTVDKLCAYCTRCNNGTLAPFTKKKENNSLLIDIGGSDKYIAVCRYHYFN